MIHKKVIKVDSEDLYSDRAGVFINIGSELGRDRVLYFGDGNYSQYTCREEFLYDTKCDEINYIGFFANDINTPKRLKLINNFFSLIEGKLKIKNPTIIYKTTDNNSLIFKVSPFWSGNIVRKSLFTLFLRCATIYYNGNFNNAIKNYELANSVKNQINWFLEGYTKTNYNISPLLENILNDSKNTLINSFEENFLGFVDEFSEDDKKLFTSKMLK